MEFFFKGEDEFSRTWCQYKKCFLYTPLTSCKKIEKSLEPFPSSSNQILDDTSKNMRLQIISRKPDVFGTCDQLESCRPY